MIFFAVLTDTKTDGTNHHSLYFEAEHGSLADIKAEFDADKTILGRRLIYRDKRQSTYEKPDLEIVGRRPLLLIKGGVFRIEEPDQHIFSEAKRAERRAS